MCIAACPLREGLKSVSRWILLLVICLLISIPALQLNEFRLVFVPGALLRPRRPQALRGASVIRRNAGEQPLCKFGVIGDIQYADCDDGTDFHGVQPRFFRHTLEVVRNAVRQWTEVDDVNFVVQMGDAIDGRNAELGSSDQAISTVLGEFPATLPRLDLLGNHELYNYPRDVLSAMGLNLYGLGKNGQSVDAQGDACYCRFPADGTDGSWEIICLDAYDVSCIGYPDGHPKRLQAEALLAQQNPRVFIDGLDWFQDVPVEKHRYVPFNGGIGEKQLSWFRDTLEDCDRNGRKAIVLTHIPILEESTTPKTVIWNADEVLQLLRGFEGRCVKAVIAGHDHDAGYAIDPHSGIHHVTMLSPLICAAGSGRTGAATVELFSDHAEIYGHGVFCVQSGTRAMGMPFDSIKLSRVDPRGW